LIHPAFSPSRRMLTFVLLCFLLHATFNGGVSSAQLLGYYQFEGSFFPSASATCPTPPFLLSPSGSATFVSPGTFDSTKNFNQALSVNTVSGTQSLGMYKNHRRRDPHPSATSQTGKTKIDQIWEYGAFRLQAFRLHAGCTPRQACRTKKPSPLSRRGLLGRCYFSMVTNRNSLLL